MAIRYCKDCQLYECCMRTPLGGCQEFDNVATNPTKPMTLEEAKQLLKMEFDWDWEKFRRDAAKDILANMLSCPTTINVGDKAIRTVGDYISCAVELADKLIKQLRGERK